MICPVFIPQPPSPILSPLPHTISATQASLLILPYTEYKAESCPRAFGLAVPFDGMFFSPAQVTCFLTSFSSLLKCHLCEAFLNYPIKNLHASLVNIPLLYLLLLFFFFFFKTFISISYIMYVICCHSPLIQMQL